MQFRRDSTPEPKINIEEIEHETPKQILTRMLIPDIRADIALAATGNQCAEKATNWLLSHVYDKELHSRSIREYSLCLVPIGAFGHQVMNFWRDSFELINWNEARNRFPHVTLIDFFEAPAKLEPKITEIVKNMNIHIIKPVEMVLVDENDYVGFNVLDPEKNFFEGVARTFVAAVKAISSDIFGQTSAITACLPRCFNKSDPTRLEPHLPRGSIDQEPNQPTNLHFKLAYKFDKNDRTTITTMIQKFEFFIADYWEMRLYSRDCLIKRLPFVYKATASNRGINKDELTYNVGDLILAEDEAKQGDGLHNGTSLATGKSGFFSTYSTFRAAESDIWVLHANVLVADPDFNINDDNAGGSAGTSAGKSAGTSAGGSISKKIGCWPRNKNTKKHIPMIYETPFPDISLEDCAREFLESPSKIIKWKPIIPRLIEPANRSDKLLIMRHGERVDHTFPDWFNHCFIDEEYVQQDINLPESLPRRYHDNLVYPWRFDPPLTNIGYHQAYLTGKMLAKTIGRITDVYCSPAFRCIQTAKAVLEGLNADKTIKIRIEPALYEFTGPKTAIEGFLTFEELTTAGYNIDKHYDQVMGFERLKECAVEDLGSLYLRQNQVTQRVVDKMKNNDLNHVLIVAHACNFETNTRFLFDEPPLQMANMKKLMATIPYASVLSLDYNERRKGWYIGRPFMLPLTQSRNFQFDQREFSTLHPRRQWKMPLDYINPDERPCGSHQ